MEKFSEFLGNYTEWKSANHPGQEIDEIDMKFIRESYAAAVRAEAKALKEGIDLTKKDGSMSAEFIKEKNKKRIDGAKTKEELIDVVTDILNAAEINTKASNRLLASMAKSRGFADCLQTVYNSILAGAGESVISNRKKESETTDFQKALKAFAEYKESHGQGPVTRSERVRIFEKTRSSKSRVVESKVTIQGVFDKLTESKKCVALAQKRLAEGDVMGAADATMAAGNAINGAETDANAMATPAAPVPQEVVDQIVQVKTAVDTLAGQAGIASPVDMGADPNAGIPAVTGVPADANAAAPAPADPNAAPVAESTVATPENEHMTEAKEATKPAIQIPSESEIVKGVATGASKEAAPADTWPTKDIKDVPAEKKLGNVEESTEVGTSKEAMKEAEEFTPDEETAAEPCGDGTCEDKTEQKVGLAEQRLEAELAKRNFKWGEFLKSGFNKR